MTKINNYIEKLKQAKSKAIESDRLKTAFREFQTILDEHPGLVATMLEELQ